MCAHIRSTNNMAEHATDPYSRVAARVVAQAAMLAGPSTTGPPVLVPPSNNPVPFADGPPGVMEMPPSPTDLLKGIHGHYIDGHAPTITWPNNVHTVLPFLDDGSGGNLLENDVNSVIQLSKSYMITSMSQVPYAQFFTKDNINSTTFLYDIRLALTHGKIIILPRFQPDVTMSFSMEDIQLHLGLAPGLEFSVHGKQQKPSVIYILDMWTGVESPMYPQQNTTLNQCVADATNISVIQMALDLFLPHIASPPSLQLVLLLPTINYPLT